MIAVIRSHCRDDPGGSCGDPASRTHLVFWCHTRPETSPFSMELFWRTQNRPHSSLGQQTPIEFVGGWQQTRNNPKPGFLTLEMVQKWGRLNALKPLLFNGPNFQGTYITAVDHYFINQETSMRRASVSPTSDQTMRRDLLYQEV